MYFKNDSVDNLHLDIEDIDPFLNYQKRQIGKLIKKEGINEKQHIYDIFEAYGI